MRITVGVIIGSVCLTAILGFILQPCLFPHQMKVSVSPNIQDITSGDPFDVTILVQDTQGRPISNAQVIIDGLHQAVSGSTTPAGELILTLQPTLEVGYHEGYLDVQVKAPCYETIEYEDMIKVYLTS